MATKYRVTNDRYDSMGTESYTMQEVAELADGDEWRQTHDGRIEVKGRHGWETLAEEWD